MGLKGQAAAVETRPARAVDLAQQQIAPSSIATDASAQSSTAAELLAEAIEDLSRDAWRIAAHADALGPMLDALKRELALAAGFQGWEAKRLPADVTALLSDIDDLAGDISAAVEDLDRTLSRLDEVEP